METLDLSLILLLGLLHVAPTNHAWVSEDGLSFEFDVGQTKHV